MHQPAQYKGVERVFTAEVPLLRTKAEFKKAAQEKQSKFLRLLHLEPSPEKHFRIAPLMEQAEREFRAIAKYSGSRVVGHTWGLYRLPNDLKRILRLQAKVCESLGAPSDHVLAAEVDVIPHHRQIIPDEPLYSDLLFNCDVYINSTRPNKIRDMGPQQFIVDLSLLSSPNQIPGEEAVVLVDIEPRFLY
ncbi:MAG TPA: hypothetical protein VFN31_01430 [Candidatus Saccharimonadales bacterium]|nr:hypothetical protein [Candidatus Saccharimonadales bacterium]